jgi:IS30 family transposase
MSDWKLAKEKHLTLEAREEIQKCLESGATNKDIARRIGKASTTVSREVKKHLVKKEAPVKHTKADGTAIVGKTCPKLLRAPFVCNPCEKHRHHCPYQKQFYYAKVAHQSYEKLLAESREGIPLNKQEFYEGDAMITEGIKKGQRLYHIMQSNDVGFSKSSAYRYLHKDYLSVNKLDLPRVVKFKARKQYRVAGVPRAAKVGRTYDDFKAFIEEHEIQHWVEMDTVIGRVGGKTIMTFDFTRDYFTQEDVNLIFSHVNSVKRKILNGRTPFEAFLFFYGDTIPAMLGIKPIPAELVIQSPKLLKMLQKPRPSYGPHVDAPAHVHREG